MTRQEMKALAKEQIKGKIGILFLITLIIGAISFVAGMVCSFIPVVGSLIPAFIITPAFTLSLVRVYLSVAKGETPAAGDAFSGFDDFWTAFKVTFFVGLYTFLWSLLFVIPGIIKAISYSQAMFIAAENPGIAAHEAINRSKVMMDGRKMEYFVLILSFLGWDLLAILTCGILYIWLMPYMYTTQVNFYNAIKPQEDVYVEEQPAPANEYVPSETVSIETEAPVVETETAPVQAEAPADAE